MKKLLLTLGAIASVAAPVAAVVACGTTPAAKHVDEGFNNASLIENFDMAGEAETTITTSEYSIDGKSYDVSTPEGLSEFVQEWAEALNSDSKFMGKLTGLVPEAGKIFASVNADNITISIRSKDDPNVDVQKTKDTFKIGEFKDKTEHMLSLNGPYKTDWETDHSFKAGTTSIKNPAVKSDSIDAILYTLSSKLKNNIETDSDKVTIEGNAPYKRSSGLGFDLNKYKKLSDSDISNLTMAADFHKGDIIKFLFDNSTDIASFLERVKYIDSSARGGGQLKDTLAETKSNIEYKVMKSESGNGFVITGIRDGAKWFTLIPTAQNEITLTFCFDIQDGYDYTGAVLGLTGFNDVNGDGKIDHLDESMTNEFVVDVATTLSSRYTNLAKKATFIYGYTDEANIK